MRLTALPPAPPTPTTLMLVLSLKLSVWAISLTIVSCSLTYMHNSIAIAPMIRALFQACTTVFSLFCCQHVHSACVDPFSHLYTALRTCVTGFSSWHPSGHPRTAPHAPRAWFPGIPTIRKADAPFWRSARAPLACRRCVLGTECSGRVCLSRAGHPQDFTFHERTACGTAHGEAFRYHATCLRRSCTAIRSSPS